MCSPREGGSCRGHARRGRGWQHPVKISFLGFFTQACLKVSHSPRVISPICALPLPICTAGSFLLTPLSSRLHCPGRPCIHTFTQTIAWLSPVSFFGVSPLWHVIYTTSLPFQTHSHLPHTCSPSQSMMPIFCWQTSILRVSVPNEHSLVFYTSLPDWAIADLPWICPGNNPVRSEIEEWGKRGSENLRRAPSRTNTSRCVESSSTVTHRSYLFCMAQAAKTEWSGKLGKNISKNFFL